MGSGSVPLANEGVLAFTNHTRTEFLQDADGVFVMNPRQLWHALQFGFGERQATFLLRKPRGVGELRL